jgi:Leucine rich repeat
VVPTESLLLLKSLRRLNLRHTALRRIEPFAFRGLLCLEHLDLGDNRLPLVIHDDAFCGIASPSFLPGFPTRKSTLQTSSAVTVTAADGVSSTSLDMTSPEPHHAGGLVVLRLDYNGLTSVSPCLLSVIASSLLKVDLVGNPLTCDCRLLEFIWSSSHWQGRLPASIGFPGAQCAQPENMAGLYLDR